MRPPPVNLLLAAPQVNAPGIRQVEHRAYHRVEGPRVRPVTDPARFVPLAGGGMDAPTTSLKVEVRPGPGVGGYSLYVDGMPATMDSRHRGEVSCAGRCGDGSPHTLLYSFAGLPGATLAVTVRCSARIVCALRAEIAGTAGSRARAGRETFAI